jgi:aminoglycoside 3-N-acetyltransferase
MRNFIRFIAPSLLLNFYRNYKKAATRKLLLKQEQAGQSLTEEQLIEQLTVAGIQKNDAVLVHASLSKIGHIKDGPITIINALKAVVGETGHILMPTSPNAGYQLDYVRNLSVFDVNETPSKLGAISEVFRKLPGVVRSENVTEPVACWGPNAQWFVEGHFQELTPYTAQSPFGRLAADGGKILYIGVTLANAGTSLHVLEDAITDFYETVYFTEIFEVSIKRAAGTVALVSTKVHDPAQSAKRRCDELLPMFKEKGVYQEVKIGQATTLVFDAKKMLDVMIAAYHEKGVTMYSPHGVNE